MNRIRVLVVDDSAVIRRVVSEVLGSDPALEVVGYASNGRLALARVPQLVPDVVILDVEMPEMDGLEALSQIREGWPRLPVIMYSTLTRRGASATLDALALGANDYVTKPSGHETPEAARRRIADDLIPRIKALCPRRAPLAASPSATAGRRTASAVVRPPVVIDLVVIGTSTGGPNALAEVLPCLPANFPASVLIVQHMPPIFTAMLAERLHVRSSIPVREAVDGAPVRPGEAWIAPGDFHMTLAGDPFKRFLRLNRDPPENSCRPAVDVLFRSAEAYGPGVLAVVLTGMGEDGFRGSRAIDERGGLVIAQDEASSVVWGMPGYVARSGLASRVLPIHQVGPAIAQLVCRQRPAPQATACPG